MDGITRWKAAIVSIDFEICKVEIQKFDKFNAFTAVRVLYNL